MAEVSSEGQIQGEGAPSPNFLLCKVSEFQSCDRAFFENAFPGSDPP